MEPHVVKEAFAKQIASKTFDVDIPFSFRL
jgi:hypothetical protein